MLLLLNADGALVLGTVGVLLICAEFCLPGWVFPGVAGGVFFLCAAHRLAQFDTSPAIAAILMIAMLGTLSAGYGFLPSWTAYPIILAIPWLCLRLAPGSIHWPAAISAGTAPVVSFLLMRIAFRASMNKTLLE